MYLVGRNGEFVRIPHEELRPVSEARLSALSTYDFAELERALVVKSGEEH